MDNDDRPWAEKVRRGMGPAMQTNATAELAMRVKALEADVQRHEERVQLLTDSVRRLATDLDDLRARVRLAY